MSWKKSPLVMSTLSTRALNPYNFSSQHSNARGMACGGVVEANLSPGGLDADQLATFVLPEVILPYPKCQPTLTSTATLPLVLTLGSPSRVIQPRVCR